MWPATAVGLQGREASSGQHMPALEGAQRAWSLCLPPRFTLPAVFLHFPPSPCSCLSFRTALKSWKVGAVLPARGWAGWQPKPELGFDFIFSYFG